MAISCDGRPARSERWISGWLVRFGLIAILSMLGTAPLAQAQERVLAPERVVGFDGVVIQCVSFVRIKFANDMCERIAASAQKLAESNGVPHRYLGRTEWGFGSDEYLALPDDSGLTNPAWLTLYIRATDRPISAFVWASLYVPVETAAGRSGRLVLWEDSGIGAGPVSEIAGGLAVGLAKKLEPVFKVLGEAGAKAQ